MCEMYLERIFLDLILRYFLLEAICYAFAVRRIPVLKQGHRWKALKNIGSEGLSTDELKGHKKLGYLLFR